MTFMMVSVGEFHKKCLDLALVIFIQKIIKKVVFYCNIIFMTIKCIYVLYIYYIYLICVTFRYKI